MSTPSPNLRLELITTGDQAGTWGTTTNTNLGTLLEDAVCGHVDVSIISADQALTAVNYAADQSRNAVISLSTTTTAPFNVYAPPAEKTYVIYNTSAYAATIYNSTVIGNTTAAGTGVTIPANKTMTVWTNGTNFRVQNDHIIGNLVGNVTGNVTGTATNATNLTGSGTISSTTTATTQAYGTNNTTVATTAFVQAALQALYPVGSVYINAAVTTNPATLLGFGTWAEIGAGRVLVGQDAGDTAFDVMGETGGSKDAIVVSHTHTYSGTTSTTTTLTGTIVAVSETFATAGSCTGVFTKSTTPNAINTPSSVDTSAAGTVTFNGNHNHTISGTTDSTGSSGTNANLQPYVVVKMWQRTA